MQLANSNPSLRLDYLVKTFITYTTPLLTWVTVWMCLALRGEPWRAPVRKQRLVNFSLKGRTLP